MILLMVWENLKSPFYAPLCEGCESKKTKSPGMRARTRENWGAKINAKMMELRSQVLAFFFCRILGKSRREYLSKKIWFCFVYFAILEVDQEKTSLFGWFFTLCPYFNPYISKWVLGKRNAESTQKWSQQWATTTNSQRLGECGGKYVGRKNPYINAWAVIAIGIDLLNFVDNL